MLPLRLEPPAGRPLSLLAIGAHPDDIEIGAGGLLLQLAARPLQARYVLLTGTAERQAEARAAATRLPARRGPDHRSLPAARGPAARGLGAGQGDPRGGGAVVLARCHPGAVRRRRAPGSPDRSARSCLPCSGTSSTWPTRSRSGTVTSAVRRCTSRCREQDARRKVELLHKCYPSQHGRDWWDDEVFLGLARLRGMECRARYAEAFSCAKSLLVPAARHDEGGT